MSDAAAGTRRDAGDTLTTEQREAVEIARGLAEAGVPVFVARPDASSSMGYVLPSGWQKTKADPGVVDAWRPGMALLAVMGHGLDLVDADPRNGSGIAETLEGCVPVSYGAALTPSGGVHSFVRSLGVRSRDNVLPGVDVKAGDADGKGRGCAFIAPTVRVSKVDGQPRPYVWAKPPDLDALRVSESDRSGAALAALVEAARTGTRQNPGGTGDGSTGRRRSANATGSAGPTGTNGAHWLDGSEGSVASFLRAGPWSDIDAALAAGRNDGVMRLASALRGRGGWQVEDALEHMGATVWPRIDQTQGWHEFPKEEFETIIRGVWDRYPDGAAERLVRDATTDRTSVKSVELTDAYLADRVSAECLAGRFLWARGLGWMSWDQQRWVSVDASVVTNTVREYLIELHREVATAGVTLEVLKRLSGLLSKARITAITELTRGVEGVHAEACAFDAHPDLLNAANGVIDLQTGELQPHDPDLRLTKLAPAEFDPDATHEDWNAALEAVPEEVREWYQQRLGQAITGHMTPDDVLIVQQGGGENGKTTVMAGIRAALGDYYLQVSHRALLANSDAHPTELMDFRGARLALLEETPEERRLSVTRLKMLVGTPEITARRIRQDPVTFPATHSLFLSTNYLPAVHETDHGTWRRLACVNFPYRWLAPHQQPRSDLDRRGDPHLRTRLTDGDDGQHAAVLAWLVAGATTWYQSGKHLPPPPGRVQEDTREWRAQADQVLAYLTERMEFDPHSHVINTELAGDLNIWLTARGHRPWSLELVGIRFTGHSEVTAHHVIKKLTRRQPGLSRPPAIPGLPSTLEGPPARYTAWLGLRFRTDTTPPDTPPGPPPNPPDPMPDTAPGPTTGGEGPGSGDDHAATTTASPAPVSAPVRAPVTSGRNRPHPTTAGRRADARATPAGRTAARAAAITEAAGPRVLLPAVVERTGPPRPVTLASAAELVRAATERAGGLTVDVETTGYPLGHADHRLRTVQLGDAHTAVVFDATDSEHAETVGGLLAVAPRLHAHSATADLVPLAHAGLVDPESGWERMHDTVIPAKLADPDSTGSDPGLKKLAETVLGDQAVSPAAERARGELFAAGRWLTDTKPDTPTARSGWAQADPASATMVRYAASDVLDTAAIAHTLPAGDPIVVERERAVQRITARVTHRGLRVDSDRVEHLIATHTQEQAAAAERVRAHGVANPGSDRQLGIVLTDLGARLPATKTGRPSVAASVLEGLRGSAGPVGDLVTAVLDYRHHETVLGLFLHPYRQLCQRGDGRVRPTVYTLGAGTGRMTCTRLNLQQVPRQGGIRSCITADPGHTLVSADFSGVELRVAAALSGDESLAGMIAEGRDLHMEIARQVWGPEATKRHRYSAKRIVFGRLYGGGIPTLAKQGGVSEQVAASAVDVLDSLTPGLSAWSHRVRDHVRQGDTHFRTYSGRVIYLPAAYPHKAPNYCIQGTARELLVDALLRWADTPWGLSTVLPVHDEILAAVGEPDARHATDALVAAMRTELFGVPITAEPSPPAPAWADAA